MKKERLRPGKLGPLVKAEKPPRKPGDPYSPGIAAMLAARKKLYQTGNPLALSPHLYREMIHLARDHSAAAVRRLISLMKSDDERIAIIAADKLLERAWGKPKDFEPDKAGSAAPDLSKLSSKDLADLRRIAGKVRGVEVPGTEPLGDAGEDAPDNAGAAALDKGADAESGPTIDAEAIEVPDEPAEGRDAPAGEK